MLACDESDDFVDKIVDSKQGMVTTATMHKIPFEKMWACRARCLVLCTVEVHVEKTKILP
jgi:hypothetical protein